MLKILTVVKFTLTKTRVLFVHHLMNVICQIRVIVHNTYLLFNMYIFLDFTYKYTYAYIGIRTFII